MVSLQCGACGTTWTPIKVGRAGVVCPHCSQPYLAPLPTLPTGPEPAVASEPPPHAVERTQSEVKSPLAPRIDLDAVRLMPDYQDAKEFYPPEDMEPDETNLQTVRNGISVLFLLPFLFVTIFWLIYLAVKHGMILLLVVVLPLQLFLFFRLVVIARR